MADAPRYYLNDDGSITNEYDTKWSAPLRKASKSWEKEPALKLFGPTILETAHLLDWRIQSRMGRIDLVTGYYPGIVPGQTQDMPGLLLRVDLESIILGRTQIKWCCPDGKHTFEGFDDRAEAAIQALTATIAQILEMGRALGLDEEAQTEPHQMALGMTG